MNGPTTQPNAALIVVDVQQDFVEGGSLAVEGGRAVASRISAYLAEHSGQYAAVVASRDWHEPHSSNGGHFAEPGTDPDFERTWPVHCVDGTTGSDYADELALDQVTHHVRKGMDVPAYSAFEGVTEQGGTLAALLDSLGVGRVDVVGLASDHCVRATVLDACRHALDVRLLEGLHAGVAPDSTERALAEMREAGASVGA